jgi:hypothetical protein
MTVESRITKILTKGVGMLHLEVKKKQVIVNCRVNKIRTAAGRNEQIKSSDIVVPHHGGHIADDNERCEPGGGHSYGEN